MERQPLTEEELNKLVSRHLLETRGRVREESLFTLTGEMVHNSGKVYCGVCGKTTVTGVSGIDQCRCRYRSGLREQVESLFTSSCRKR